MVYRREETTVDSREEDELSFFTSAHCAWAIMVFHAWTLERSFFAKRSALNETHGPEWPLRALGSNF